MSICGIPACTVSAHEREQRLWAALERIRKALESGALNTKQQIADILDEVEFNG